MFVQQKGEELNEYSNDCEYKKLALFQYGKSLSVYTL